jgi:hypothetical protein
MGRLKRRRLKMNKRIDWEDVVSDVVFAIALLQVAIFNQWGGFVVLPVAVVQSVIVRFPKKSVYNEGGWHGFAFLLGSVIVGDMFLNIVFKMMMPAKYAPTVAVLAAVLVMTYSVVKTAWAVLNKKS